jgi:REP-associated tyrosine transposase
MRLYVGVVPRSERLQVPGGIYHVVARGVAGAPIFLDNVDRRTFVRLLRRVTRRHRWRVHAFCLMTTHVHLVVETPRANISRGMQQLLSVHAQRFNMRWGRFGHLFADRFSSRLIDDEEYFWEACRYVFDNPVAAGICGSAEAWPWSGGLAFSDMAEGLARK